MLLLVVSCTVPHRSNPVSEGPVVLQRLMVNKSAQPCAGRENRHEIPLFTLTLDGERDITRSSTISLAPQDLAAKWCVRETFGSILPNTPLQSSTGFVESSTHHTKEVCENGDSWGFVLHTPPLSFGLGRKRDETRFGAL